MGLYQIVRTDQEIGDQLSKALENDGGTRWPGMTYEQGVAAGIDWITGHNDEPPMEDE